MDAEDDRRVRKENVFLAPFLNVFFYLFLLPFRIKFDDAKGQYYLQHFGLHKIVVGLLHLTVLACSVYLLVQNALTFRFAEAESIVTAFDFVSNLCSLISALLIMRIFWRQQDQLLEVIESVKWNLTGRNLACIRFAELCDREKLYSVLFGIFIYLCVISWLLMTDTSHYASLPPLDMNFTGIPPSALLTTIMSHGMYLLVMPSSWMYLLLEGTMIMLVLELRHLGHDFQREVSLLSVDNEDADKVLELYRDLKGSTQKIELLFGDILLYYVISSISYYAETPHILMGKRGDAEIGLLAYCGLSCAVWIISANFYLNVRNALLQWSDAHAYKGSVHIERRLKLLSVTQEMMLRPVALSSKYFPVTSNFVGSMLGVVITYGILVFQLQHDHFCKST